MGEKIKDRESLGLSMGVASEDDASPKKMAKDFQSEPDVQQEKKVKKNSSKKSQNGKSKLNKKACKMYLFWVIGLIISFIPLLAVPFSQKIMGEGDVNFFTTIFQSAEIIFIGITLAISALNTYIGTKTNSDLWIWSNIIVIILGALCYGIIVTLMQQSTTVDYRFLVYFNLSFFVIVFLLGSYKYIMNILNIKNICHIKDLFGGSTNNG